MYEQEHDEYAVSVSFHRQQESRDRIRSSLAREMQGFVVDTYGLFAHARTRLSDRFRLQPGCGDQLPVFGNSQLCFNLF